MNAPDDQAATAIAEAIHDAACNERADGAPYCTWSEDLAVCDTSGQMPLAQAAITALRNLGWAPASETAETIALNIDAYNASRGGYDETALDCARIARGEP